MASPPIVAIDPRKHEQYTLKIGKGLKSGASSSSSSFSSVKFNHKPTLSSGSRSTKLSRGSDGNASLLITDQEAGSTAKYAYKGRRSTPKSSYVLIFDPDTQTCTLEPVKSSYNFNLTSTPWETSQEKLSRQYEQLRPDEATTANDLDEDPDGEPDADNPYDFRHYLNIKAKPSPSPSPALKPLSTVNTPTLASTRPSAIAAPKQQSRPTPKTDPLRQAPRKQKTAPPTGRANQKPTPTVRLDRRASTRPGDEPERKVAKPPKARARSSIKSDYYVHSSDEDDAAEAGKNVDGKEVGGLEIDWGSQQPKKEKSRVLDLPDSAHDGPISLHSAANSPAGRMAVPRQQRKKHEYEQDVIDFGASEGYDEDDGQRESQPLSRNVREDGDVQMRDAEESDGDADVEPMELGSPAHQKPAQDPAPVEDDEDADFDDDFEAQMMEAMASEDEDDQPAAQEESDESEAE